MAVGATLGTISTATSVVGEIPVVGDVLSDIPVIGGLFGGGPEDIDASEVREKLYPGRWSQLDDEMEPTRSGASSAASALRQRMAQAPEIEQAASQWASQFVQQLQSKDLMQNVRGPSGPDEVANVVAWAAHGGAGSNDWGPAGMEGAQQILDLRPEQFRDPAAGGGGGGALGGVSPAVLLAGGAVLTGVVLLAGE